MRSALRRHLLPATPRAGLPATLTAGLVAVAAAGLVVAAAAAPADARSSFSTAPVQVAATSTTQTVITGVRVGHHPAWDRVVLDLSGPVPGYSVRYVDHVVADASGRTVPLRGSAALEVVLRPTSTTVHAVQPSLTPGLPAVRQVKGAGDFEAVTTYGIGVAGRLPFRVLTLNAPNRLVIDVAVPVESSAGGTATGSTAGHTGTGGTSTGGTTTGQLPFTGSPTGLLTAAGAGLVVTGGGLLLARRRHVTA